MNDPGFDPAITNAATEADGNSGNESSRPQMDDPEGTYIHWAAEERELAQFLQPTRWWIASTEIPLLAATFGPMANAFSICSLSQHWRMIIHPGLGPDQGQDLDDPAWAIAVNAVSLAFALIANICLLLTMAQRLSFTTAQPIVIVGWYISSVLLIIILAMMSHEVGSSGDPNMQMTQGYYYGTIAAALYSFLSTLLMFTLYGAYNGHYDKEFKLTTSQRTLMVQTISFLVYLLAGSAVYMHIEGWRYTNSIYWSTFTLLTIGMGQPAPLTHLGRGLLFPYAFGGILILGIVIGSIRSLVLERGKMKMSFRLIEKTRNALAKKMMSNKANVISPLIPVIDDPAMDEQDRRRREFHAMRKVRQIAAVEHRWLSLFFSGTAVATLWCIGALIFEHAEGTQQWTYFEGLYFAYTSLLTIGYGDFYLMSNWGRAFFVFWALLAVPTMTIFISNLGDTFIKAFRDFSNFLSELTILPGNKRARDRFKDLFRKRAWSLYPPEEDQTDKRGSEQGSPPPENGPVERAESALEEGEIQEQEEAHARGDILAENIHHYQYLLISELRQMFRYVNMTPPKQFDYDEWSYYLKLLGEDESAAKKHRNPPVDIAAEDVPNGKQHGEEETSSKRGRWSWIGHRSPLLGDKEEAEWLLEALADKLERELRKRREEYEQSKNKPPSEQQPSSDSR